MGDIMTSWRIVIQVQEVDDDGQVQDIIGEWEPDNWIRFGSPSDAITNGQRARKAVERLRPIISRK